MAIIRSWWRTRREILNRKFIDTPCYIFLSLPNQATFYFHNHNTINFSISFSNYFHNHTNHCAYHNMILFWCLIITCNQQNIKALKFLAGLISNVNWTWDGITNNCLYENYNILNHEISSFIFIKRFASSQTYLQNCSWQLLWKCITRQYRSNFTNQQFDHADHIHSLAIWSITIGICSLDTQIKSKVKQSHFGISPNYH